MDPNLIVVGTGLAIQTVTSALQAYVTFRKTNVEKYFGLLLESEVKIDKIEENPKLKEAFFTIVEKVSRECNLEKIKKWKDATVHIVTDFSDFDFKDNLIQTLDVLTALDLTVLEMIYNNDFSEGTLEDEVVKYFKRLKVPTYITQQGIRRLASHGLLTVRENRVGVFGDSSGPSLGSIYYVINDFGPIFIKFISEEYKDIADM